MMVDVDKVIRRVYENKSTGQKLVTIPKDSDIQVGDYVKLEKVNV